MPWSLSTRTRAASGSNSDAVTAERTTLEHQHYRALLVHASHDYRAGLGKAPTPSPEDFAGPAQSAGPADARIGHGPGHRSGEGASAGVSLAARGRGSHRRRDRAQGQTDQAQPWPPSGEVALRRRFTRPLEPGGPGDAGIGQRARRHCGRWPSAGVPLACMRLLAPPLMVTNPSGAGLREREAVPSVGAAEPVVGEDGWTSGGPLDPSSTTQDLMVLAMVDEHLSEVPHRWAPDQEPQDQQRRRCCCYEPMNPRSG